MEQEYPVPGFPDYTVTKDGKVYSHKGKGGNRHLMKIQKRKYPGRKRFEYNVTLWTKNEHGESARKLYNYPRLILSAKLGRPLEDWEQARHMDGNWDNNHMDNLQAGCVLNNMIDDIEKGTRQTSAAYVDQAIQRLRELRKSL